MTALPVHSAPGPDDPAEILRMLPAEYHAAFLAEYAEAVEGARRPEQFRELTTLLRFWYLRAVAYSDPGYADRLATARAGDTVGDVPLEQLVARRPTA
ncbi:MAG: DUF6247 family protein [Sporichthyaceae bacterium]